MKTLDLTGEEAAALKLSVMIAEWFLHESYTEKELKLHGFSFKDYKSMREKLLGQESGTGLREAKVNNTETA